MFILVFPAAFLVAIGLPLVLCLLQPPRRPFVLAYLIGSLFWGVVVYAWVAAELQGSSDPSPLVWLFVGPAAGAVYGAWVGVAAATLVVGPTERRIRAGWGAVAGLLVGAALWPMGGKELALNHGLELPVVAWALASSLLMAVGAAVRGQLRK